ncbi:hypothetical protein RB595_000174 [Gaeumannomyces hyphopodioides]
MHLRSILIMDGDPLDDSGGGGGGGGADRHPDFPMLPADTRTGRDGNPIYHAAMRLPRPTDRRAVCEFLGLADAMCASVVAHAAARHGDAASSPAEGVVRVLVESYLARGRPGGPALPPRHGPQDDPETHQGLQPRFATGIGGRVEMAPTWASHMVDSSPSASSSSSSTTTGGPASPPPHQYFSRLFRTSAREDADAIVRRNAEVLRHLWGQQRQQQQQQQQLAAGQS